MIALLFWCALTMATIVLLAMTVSYIYHARNRDICRVCVDKKTRALRRHPSFVAPEDRPEWGEFR